MAAIQSSPTYMVAYDGSKHARAAIEFLCDICEPLSNERKIKVHLLTVFTPRQIKDHDMLNTNLVQAQQYMQGKHCFDVSSDLILGYPSEKILEFSEQLNPDMILVGAKGLRSTLGILLGGVAQQVVEYSCCPVYVARAPYHKTNHVLLVMDSSTYSKQALDYLIKLHLPTSVRTSVLHVMSPMPLVTIPSSSEIWPSRIDQIPLPKIRSAETVDEIAWLEEEEKLANELLDFATSSLKSSGHAVERVLLRGDAATEILEFSKEKEVDLIISGSRGLSQLRGLLLGSVSRKLVHYAGCSVLIVKSYNEN